MRWNTIKSFHGTERSIFQDLFGEGSYPFAFVSESPSSLQYFSIANRGAKSSTTYFIAFFRSGVSLLQLKRRNYCRALINELPPRMYRIDGDVYAGGCAYETMATEIGRGELSKWQFGAGVSGGAEHMGLHFGMSHQTEHCLLFTAERVFRKDFVISAGELHGAIRSDIVVRVVHRYLRRTTGRYPPEGREHYQRWHSRRYFPEGQKRALRSSGTGVFWMYFQFYYAK